MIEPCVYHLDRRATCSILVEGGGIIAVCVECCNRIMAGRMAHDHR